MLLCWIGTDWDFLVVTLVYGHRKRVFESRLVWDPLGPFPLTATGAFNLSFRTRLEKGAKLPLATVLNLDGIAYACELLAVPFH